MEIQGSQDYVVEWVSSQYLVLFKECYWDFDLDVQF